MNDPRAPRKIRQDRFARFGEYDMATHQFREHKFYRKSLPLLEAVQTVLAEYAAQGYILTLRQLFYQLVTRLVVENAQKAYDRVGELVKNGRESGVIDWDLIEDRSRDVVENGHWDSPAQLVAAISRQYRVDRWADQPHRVLVVVEKQALEGILIPVCRELDVPFAALKGYNSTTQFYTMGQRIAAWRRDGQTAHALYLGDHDASGVDITRDLKFRLERFSEGPVVYTRLALNRDQVERFSLPPCRVKDEDSRTARYVQTHGEETWELDALEPRYLATLVREAVIAHRDEQRWQAQVAREATARRAIERAAQSLEEA